MKYKEIDMEYAVLENGMPFEVINTSSGKLENDTETFLEKEVELCEENFFMHTVENAKTKQINSLPDKTNTQRGHFNCLVIGIGNYGCQNIDFILEKTSRCSCIKINADLSSQELACQSIIVEEEQIENGVDETLHAYLQGQLEPHIEGADIVILVSSLTDEMSDITPVICQQLNKTKKSNLVVLFKPTNHIQSEVDKAKVILDKVKEAQKDEALIKNALVVLSEEKANQCYQVVRDRWAGLFATVYEITECLDTFLDPQNRPQIRLSRVRKMLNCGGPTFFGRVIMKHNSEEDQSFNVANLPDILATQSFVDIERLNYACNLVAIIKSSSDFSTDIENQFRTQLGEIANAYYERWKKPQVVEISHLYDQTIASDEMEVILLITGIEMGEAGLMDSERHDNEAQAIKAQTLSSALDSKEGNEESSDIIKNTQASSHPEKISTDSPLLASQSSLIASPPKPKPQKTQTPIKQPPIKGLSPNASKIISLSNKLAKPPSLQNRESIDEDIAVLKMQQN